MKVRLVGDKLSLELFGVAGIPGRCPQTAAETREAIEEFSRDREVGVVLVTSSRAALLGSEFKPYLLRRKLPLVLRIPDRQDQEGGVDEIKNTLQSSLGIRL